MFLTNLSFFSCLLLLSSPLLHLHAHGDPAAILANATCGSTCGPIPVKFPFGTGSGCGHPAFARYVQCRSGSLQFSTGTGTYRVESINYSSSSMVVSDPLMSTCSSMQNSGSFVLDRASPFAVAPDNVFVLLGCSATSPVFDRDEGLCQGGSGSGARACEGLYSCKGVAGIGFGSDAPISTCCVYDPPGGSWSGLRVDLPKLQCSSYASIYGFGEDEEDPRQWEFGVLMQYNDSYRTSACGACEASGGACGYGGFGDAFACVCRNGQNTTSVCSGRGLAWSGGAWGPRSRAKMSILATKGYLISLMVMFIWKG